MDDSIFVDLVNALLVYEKDDKEKETPKKMKESSKDKESVKEEKEKGEAKTEVKSEKSDELKDKDNPRFPSMQIFGVNVQSERNYSTKLENLKLN